MFSGHLHGNSKPETAKAISAGNSSGIAVLKQRKSPPPVLLYNLFNFSSTSLSKTRDRLLYRPPILFAPATTQKSRRGTYDGPPQLLCVDHYLPFQADCSI